MLASRYVTAAYARQSGAPAALTAKPTPSRSLDSFPTSQPPRQPQHARARAVTGRPRAAALQRRPDPAAARSHAPPLQPPLLPGRRACACTWGTTARPGLASPHLARPRVRPQAVAFGAALGARWNFKAFVRAALNRNNSARLRAVQLRAQKAGAPRYSLSSFFGAAFPAAQHNGIVARGARLAVLSRWRCRCEKAVLLLSVL